MKITLNISKIKAYLSRKEGGVELIINSSLLIMILSRTTNLFTYDKVRSFTYVLLSNITTIMCFTLG